MIKNLFSVFLTFLFLNSIHAQQVNDVQGKRNPIIYMDGFFGPSAVRKIGISGGVELNYQSGKSLFSFRYINSAGYTRTPNILIYLPAYYKSDDNSEYALLYGRRWLMENHSYSISAGISYNNLELAGRDSDDNRFSYYKNFYAVPFEANYKWYYRKKKSKLIYNAMIPSVGVKLFGHVGAYSLIGVGVSVGFGFSKQY
ncbi:MAG: hypothetical protein ABI441_13650 [Flavobacterium sp.]